MVSRFIGFLLVGLLFQSTPQPSSAQELPASPATLIVKVPADAIVEVDGRATTSTGSRRVLRTQFIPTGTKDVYWHMFKVTYSHKGQKVVIEKKVILEPGKQIELDFLPLEVVQKTDVPEKEKPKKVEAEKEKPKKEIHIDVVYVPTPQPVVDAMLKLAEVKETDVVYDLGCGDGRIVVTAVKKFKAKKGLGLELAPERVLLSKENAKKNDVADKVEIREGSVFDLKDVSEASVVTLYLYPEINRKLMPMLRKTLKPGSRIVSHDFDMGDWKADQEINVKVQGDRDHTVFLWIIKDPKKEEPKKEEPKKEEPKKEELKKEEPKKEEPKQPTGESLPLPREIGPKIETPKNPPKADEPKKEPKP